MIGKEDVLRYLQHSIEECEMNLRRCAVCVEECEMKVKLSDVETLVDFMHRLEALMRESREPDA